MTALMELTPLYGLGPIRFGMTPAEVRAAFAEPEMYEEWMGGNLNDSLLFHALIVRFDQCNAYGPLPDARCTDLVVHGRPDVSFLGMPVDQLTRDGLLATLKRRAIRYQDDSRGGLLLPAGCVGIDFDANAHIAEIQAWKNG